MKENQLKFLFLHFFVVPQKVSCGVSKGFMKALKTFIKPFGAPQRSVKIKIYVDFYFNTTFWNARVGKS